VIAASWSRLLIALGPLLLSACASGSILERAETDRSIITGSVSAPSPRASAMTDEAVIGAAVSSAETGKTGATDIAWTNPSTGASGRITAIVEYEDNGALCRRFSLSRTRYDGVSLLHGHMCLGAPGDPGGWQVPSLGAS
jgi:hypothetical protein